MDYSRRLKRIKCGQDILNWLKKQQDENNGLPCELLEIQSLKDDSEKCIGYRNKCEFTIGKVFGILIKYVFVFYIDKISVIIAM